MRIIAAISIILTHLHYFFPVESNIRSIFSFFGTCGLAAFFFFSGYFISKTQLDNQQVGRFLSDRLRRLFPAMYIAIILYITVEILGFGSPKWDIPINVWSILSNLFGLQIYFYPLRFFALWYISAILTYYIIHFFIKKASGESLNKYISISLLCFLFVGLLTQINLPLYGFDIDNRIFGYYYVFFIGIIVFDILESDKYWTIIYPILLASSLLIINFLLKFSGHGSLSIFELPTFFTLLMLVILLVTIRYDLYSPIKKIPDFIKKCSYSTYSVYLLHYPLLCLIATLGIQNLFVFIFISIIVTFTFGFILQTCIDMIFLRKLSST